MVGCQNWQGVSAQTVPLGELNKHRDQTVTVRGAVQAQAPFVGGGAYRLVDASGSVWVLTGRPLPAKGTELTVEGRVKYEAVPLGGRDWGDLYLQEVRLVNGGDVGVTVPTVTPPVVVPPANAIPPVKPPKPILDLIFLPHR